MASRRGSVAWCFLLSSLLGSHNVASPLEMPSPRRTPPPLSSELGCSPTLSIVLGKQGFFFDPLLLATDENFSRYRESELKHGRIAMVATIGMVFPRVLVEKLLSSISALKGAVSLPEPRQVSVGVLEALREMTTEGWLQILVTCGVLEIFVFYQRSSQDMPGDYGTGYLGLRDKARHERSLECELENGRLAMVAFVFQVVSEIVSRQSIAEQLNVATKVITESVAASSLV